MPSGNDSEARQIESMFPTGIGEFFAVNLTDSSRSNNRHLIQTSNATTTTATTTNSSSNILHAQQPVPSTTNEPRHIGRGSAAVNADPNTLEIKTIKNNGMHIHGGYNNFASFKSRLESTLQGQSEERQEQLIVESNDLSHMLSSTNNHNNSNNNNIPTHIQHLQAAYNNSSSSIPIKRSNKACDYCRRKKVRCGAIDENTGKCSNCMRNDKDCTFNFHIELERKRKSYNGRRRRKRKQKGIEIENTNDDTDHSENIFAYENSLENELDNTSIRHTNNNINNNIPIISNNNNNNINDKIKDFTNIIQEINTFDSQSNVSFQKLVRKINVLADIERNTMNLFDKLEEFKNTPKVDEEFLPKCKKKHYKTSMITLEKIRWIKNKIGKDVGSEFYDPMHETFINITKWYLIQLKKMTDFSSFLEIDKLTGKPKLFDLPERKEQSARLLENLHTCLLYSSNCVVSRDETIQLLDKYYDKSKRITFEENFLLHVCLISGVQASALLTTKDIYFLRKDRYLPSGEELKNMENKLFINIAYYYSKIQVHSANIDIFKGLLLWSVYIQSIVGLEIAVEIFRKAISVALSLGLHKMSYYLKLPAKEALLEKCLWTYCILFDRMQALRLSLPPLLDKGLGISSLLSEESFYNDIRRIVAERPDLIADPYQLKITNFKEALEFTIHHTKFLTVAMSFYGSKLIELETDILNVCFSNESIGDSAFLTVLCKSLKIHERLKDWNEGLHPVMKLETFRDYYKLLSLQNTEGNPELQFEVVCSRILMFQFRFLSLSITLCHFIISLISDNNSTLVDSADKLAETERIKERLTLHYIESSKRVLTIFMDIQNQPFLYREVVYFFYTAVFTLIFHVIDRIDDKDHELENVLLLDLLQKTHTHLILMDENKVFCDNMKWNAGLLIYSYLLQLVIQYCNGRNQYAKGFNFRIEKYNDTLNLLQSYSSEVKNIQMKCLENCHYNKSNGRPSKFGLFQAIDTNFINILKREGIHFKSIRQEESIDHSIFSVQCPAEVGGENFDEEECKNDDFQFLSLSSFFYDRDLSFLNIFKEWNII